MRIPPGHFIIASRRRQVDAVFVVLTLVLYATTHWLVRALGKLGGDG
jgi:hypothetical protein